MTIGPAGGIAFLKIDGNQYQLAGEFEIQPNKTENEFLPNSDKTISRVVKTVTPYIQAKIRDSGGLSLQALGAIVDATLTVELNNGKTYVMRHAAPWGEVKATLNNAEVGTIKFGGHDCFELLA